MTLTLLECAMSEGGGSFSTSLILHYEGRHKRCWADHRRIITVPVDAGESIFPGCFTAITKFDDRCRHMNVFEETKRFSAPGYVELDPLTSHWLLGVVESIEVYPFFLHEYTFDPERVEPFPNNNVERGQLMANGYVFRDQKDALFWKMRYG